MNVNRFSVRLKVATELTNLFARETVVTMRLIAYYNVFDVAGNADYIQLKALDMKR